MRGKVVERLVLSEAATARVPSAPLPQSSALVFFLLPLFKFWLNSRVTCMAMWAVSSGFLVACMWGEIGSWVVEVVYPIGLTTMLFLFPWLFLRWRHRCAQRSAVRRLEDIFAEVRVTREEWSEAKRLIRESNPTFFLYGTARHLDQRCVL